MQLCPNVIVLIQLFIGKFHSYLISFSLIFMKNCVTVFTKSSLYSVLYVCNSYFLSAGCYYSFFFITRNICSIGFNHGEYSQLNITCAFICLAVSKTVGCTCILALSMNITMSFVFNWGSFLTLISV